MPRDLNHGAPHPAAAIMATFSSTGSGQVRAKRFQVFRMPVDKP